jgi:polysaccharide deacetylase 2 family uncharacterized protein YibQ
MIRRPTSSIVIILGVIVFLGAVVSTFYIFGSNKSDSLNFIERVEDNVSTEKNLFKSESTSVFTTECNNSTLVEVEVIPSESEDYISSFSNTTIHRTLNESLEPPLENFISLDEEVNKSIKKSDKTTKKLVPRLAIIMDDVAFKSQIKELKKIKYPITPAFFPKSCRYPNTPSLAKKFNHYMIHMPMEALRYIAPEESTLLVSDLNSVLDVKISKVIEDFPTAIAINNHTGSKFTSSSDAMNRLFSILKKYHINFIDSRTSAETKAVKIGEIYNAQVLERNIFLDNKADVSYIQKQLKKAVLYAKKHGQSIAICHPRETTFEALKNSKEILKGVKLVYIDACYD